MYQISLSERKHKEDTHWHHTQTFLTDGGFLVDASLERIKSGGFSRCFADGRCRGVLFLGGLLCVKLVMDVALLPFWRGLHFMFHPSFFAIVTRCTLWDRKT